MTKKTDDQSEKYKRLRQDFDSLGFERKATFIAEALFSTMAKGVDQVSSVVAEELNNLFDDNGYKTEKEASTTTRKKQAASGGRKSTTTRKKTARKRKTTKKKSSQRASGSTRTDRDSDTVSGAD